MNHRQVVHDGRMRQHHAARVARGARGVLEKGEPTHWARANQFRCGGAQHRFGIEPRDVRERGRILDELFQPVMQRRRHDRDLRTAIGHDAGNSRIRPAGIGWIRRNGHDARVLAREQRRDVVQARRQQEHDARARGGDLRDMTGHARRAVAEDRVGEHAVLLASGRQEPIRRGRPVALGAVLQHVHERAAACALGVILQQGIQGRSSGISAATAGARAFRRNHPA